MDEYHGGIEYDDAPLRELTLPEVLENRAEALGSRPFLLSGRDERRVSFADLNATANSIGNGFADAGIDRGARVSTIVEDNIRTIELLFGIAKAGGIYTPINYEYEGDPLAYQLNDSRPEALIVDSSYLDRLADVADELSVHPDVYVYDDGTDPVSLPDSFTRHSFETLVGDPDTAPDVPVAWHDPAWIMYTSGTTGFPKGVVLPHRFAILNHAGIKARQFDADDVVHNWMPLYHIGGASGQILSALLAGARVGVWNGFSRSQFWDRVETFEATSVTMLTVMLQWLMSEPETETDHHNTLNKVQVAELPDNYVEIAERFGFDMYNISYSQTEIGAATWGVIRGVPEDRRTPSELFRGRPIDDVVDRMRSIDVPVVDRAPGDDWMGRPRGTLFEVTTLDDHDATVPDGEVGEIAVRPKRPGVILHEYLNKPEKMVEDTRNLWMHSDDLGIHDGDGNFYFVDRKNDIIRRRGENISSEQLEDVINRHERVESTAVFPVKHPEEQKEDDIAVAIRTIDGERLTEAAVREYLEARVADFMLPQHVEFVDEMPTTQTNKVRKTELRERLFDR